MSAYYNEIDPYAAEWLRNLIAARLIALGDVDERSITVVSAEDLRGYDQCHFFAGIGVWSYALRLAGWPDDRPVWTGSCPCQPFSAAGKQQGTSDERHLWPAWFKLIDQCNPPVVFGEQVEAAIRHGWLDLVQSDMEGIGYAFAAAGIPAAGFGAPHIRQRLWFVADSAAGSVADADNGSEHALLRTKQNNPAENVRRGATGGLGGQMAGRNEGQLGRLDHHHHPRLEGLGSRHQAEGGWHGAVRSVATAGESGGVGFSDSKTVRGQPGASDSAEGKAGDRPHGNAVGAPSLLAQEQPAASPTNGHWAAADWLHCRDGKWRPVEPGTFPLAHGAAARVGRLRAYGNAIVPQVAAEVIAAFMEVQ